MDNIPERRMPKGIRKPRRLAGPSQAEAHQYLSIDRFPPEAVHGGQNALETTFKLWRRRWFILGVTLAAAAVSTVVVTSMPTLYSSEARVLVGVPGPRALNVEAVLTDLSPDAERVQDESFVLQSRSIARQVVDQLNLRENPDFNPEMRSPSFWKRYLDPRAYLPDWSTVAEYLPAWLSGPKARPASGEAALHAQRENRIIDKLLSRVDVSTLGRSHVLSVKAEAADPDVAAAIANTLADAYLDYQRADKVNSMDRVDKFLINRVRDLRDQVRKSDQAVEDYRRIHGLYKSGTGSVTTQQLTELNSQLTAAQTAMVEATSRLTEAQEMRKGSLGNESVPEVLRSPLITLLKQQQAEAERRAAELAAGYGERHQLLRNARAETASIASRIASEVAKIVEGLARDARSAEARYATLRDSFEKLKSQMGEVNVQSIQLESLERDALVNRNLLEAVLSRAKQTMGTTDLLQANAKLVSAAAASEVPSFPPKTLIVTLGAMFGALIGAALTLLLETNDRTFRRADQVEALTGLPVMAMVPSVRSRAPIRHALEEPTGPYSEALRRLNLGIELSESKSSPRTIMFASSEPAEGKSVLTASLGTLLASNGKKVLLIDCDWRKPHLHQLFRFSNRVGLSNLLAADGTTLNECIHHDAQSGVDVLPAGSWTPKIANLLHSEQMSQLIEMLSAAYDKILLDTTPVLLSADILSLSRQVDKVVFVVRWGHTLKETATEGLRQLLDVRGNVAGIAMMRVLAKKLKQYRYGPTPSNRGRLSVLRME
jgi:succinoglycan biosynthesis transport protein ExoP